MVIDGAVLRGSGPSLVFLPRPGCRRSTAKCALSDEEVLMLR